MPRNFGPFFGHFDEYFTGILHNNCSSEYQAHLTQPEPWPNFHANNVVSCLLGNFDESGKAQLAVSSVLLGGLLTILGMVGSNTSEMGLLVLRRPFLALLVSYGAPVISPLRSFDYRDPLEILQPQGRSGGAMMAIATPERRLWIRIIEYSYALVAVGNVFHVIWQLCRYSVCAFSARDPWLVVIWYATSIAAPILGAIAVGSGVRSTPAELLKHALRGDRAFKELASAKLRYNPDSKGYAILSWLASLVAMLHTFCGVVVLSSALFISPSDAVVISFRLFLSAVVCRLCLMVELQVNGLLLTP